ncbi:MAG: ATP-binding cassette domain-containing protein, partial [Planctomycetota bacterium]|nr:ATP-binding cassette domain-containing protein [Planctomycetota bacterium]
MLVVEGLRARVGAFMLGPLDVRVAPGCVHAVLGPSGAGKSSLLACLLGAQPATADRLSLDGHEIGGLPIERRGIGFVPQRPSLFPHLNVREQLWYGVRARRLPADAAAAAIDRLV